jgi:DNA polymerase-3 subunit delta'
VLATIASRCQAVRFDPLPPSLIAARLQAALADVEPEQARACARLALGDARLAARLAGEQGRALRAGAEAFVRSAVRGATGERRWLEMLDVAKAAGAAAGETEGERLREELELVPSKERKRYEREGADARRRIERRARTQALDLTLRLAELWLRDVLCIAEGARECVYAVDRLTELADDAEGRAGESLRTAVELVQDTRLRLAVNVSEELALEALCYRVERQLVNKRG